MADKKYAAVVGGRVVKLGKVSGQKAFQAAGEIAPRDNEFTVKDRAPLYMAMAEVLDGLGLVDDMEAVPLTVEKNGIETTVVLMPEAGLFPMDGFAVPPGWVDARDANAPLPLWLRHSDDYFWFEYLADSRTIYVQFNAVADKNDETVEAFFKRVMAFAETHPVDRFVFDERLNGGGNNYLLRPIIHGFIRSDTVNQPGKLFTIIGRKTFSAAMNCVNRMKLDTNTLFVGEPTGSSPNMYGDNTPVVLPNSKLSMRLSSVWWQDMDPRDVRIWQAPDLSTELTFADYRAGRDPAMEAILSHKPGVDVVTLVGAAVEKNDYAGAKAALLNFTRDPLHKYSSAEAELNELGYKLVSVNKLDQAILVMKLNTEVYPDSFNAWDSLGEVYMDRGDKQLAIQSYSRSLELNPKNSNARERLVKLRAQ
jgi:tetratricopeptide (TPR) repeat protein